jgi:DNA-binding NarL/FixJ family response regulator
MTKVAIVEDNPTLRQYLAELISNTVGYRCVGTCGSAEEAAVKLPEMQPDVVLMDIHLPGQSGIACTAYLGGKMPSVLLLVIDSRTRTRHQIFARNSGARHIGSPGWMPNAS